MWYFIFVDFIFYSGAVAAGGYGGSPRAGQPSRSDVPAPQAHPGLVQRDDLAEAGCDAGSWVPPPGHAFRTRHRGQLDGREASYVRAHP